MSLRRKLHASLVEVLLNMDQRRGPKPACPESVRHQCGSCSVNVRHWMQSFACATSITSVIRTYSLQVLLLLLLLCRGSTVLSHHVGLRRMMWLKWDEQALPLLPAWLYVASLAYGALWHVNVVVLCATTNNGQVPTQSQPSYVLRASCFSDGSLSNTQDNNDAPLETEMSPLDANLEAVTPGMSQWQSVNHQLVQGLRVSVKHLSDTVKEGFCRVNANAQREQESCDEYLAAVLVNVARELVSKKRMPIIMDIENPKKKRSLEAEPPSDAITRPVTVSPSATNPCAEHGMVPTHTSLVEQVARFRRLRRLIRWCPQ